MNFSKKFYFQIQDNDRFSGNDRYSGLKGPDHFSAIYVVACSEKLKQKTQKLKQKLKVSANPLLIISLLAEKRSNKACIIFEILKKCIQAECFISRLLTM